MAKDTRVKFDNEATAPSSKSSATSKSRRGAERQISYEETENCVNEINESFPALHNMNKAHRFMRQVSNSFSSRTIKVALILSVSLNLLICIPFGIFIGIWMSNNTQSNNNNNHLINHQNNNLNTALQSNHHRMPSSSSSSSSQQSSSKFLNTLSSSNTNSNNHNSNNLNNENNIDNTNLASMESCVPCSSLAKHVKVKVRSKNNICCTDVKTPAVGGATYLVLSDEYIKRKLEEINAIASGCAGGDKSDKAALDNPRRSMEVNAAHLMLNVEKTKENVGRKVQRPLTWITNDRKKRAFVRDDLTYSKGHLVVRHAGVYHVYSHLTLTSLGKNNKFEGNKKTQVVHSITKYYKTPERRDETLLFSQVSIGEDDLKTTNLEGSFELEAGDELAVYISYPSLLTDDLTANVFGLFKL